MGYDKTRRPATDKQLYRLNVLGYIKFALDPDGYMYFGKASEILKGAADRGEWTPVRRKGVASDRLPRSEATQTTA